MSVLKNNFALIN